jgi:dienelactone hydrolase
VHALEDAMKAAGKSLEVKIYDNASHEFLDPDLPRRDALGRSLYRSEDAEDVSKRINALFSKTLKPSREK